MVLHRMFHACFLFSLVWLTLQKSTDIKLQEVYSWKSVDYTYDSPEKRAEAVENKEFIAENIVLLDADYYMGSVCIIKGMCSTTSKLAYSYLRNMGDPNSQEKRFYVTTPVIFMEGFPATLSMVTNEKNEDTVLLKPFPSWEANDRKSCDGIISVYRIQIDKCGNLWVVDTGEIDGFVSRKHICPRKLLIYDLKNKDSPKELVRYEFNEQSLKPETISINLIIESTAEDCSDAVAYLTDTRGFGIIIYDRKQNTSWRIDHPSCALDPNYVSMTINGVTLSAIDGIFGLALGNSEDNSQILYWQSFASLAESWISTKILKDQEAAANSELLNSEITTAENGRESQSTVSVITSDLIMVYTLVAKNALACWNTRLPYTRENQHIIMQDDANFQFISNMKLRGKELIIISTMLQKMVAGTSVKDEIKYRILSIGNVDDLLKDTPCLQQS